MPHLLQLARPLARLPSRTSSPALLRTLTTQTPSKRFDMPAPSKPSARKSNPQTYPDPDLPKLTGSLPPPSKSADELLADGSPYLLRRTAYGQLPVYRRWRGGGTLEEVLVKKIEGNPRPLVQDLTAMLGCAPENVKINPTTNQIIIKGDHYERTRSWLVHQGF
ncbi:mitochondrial large subunit ribosomal protein (Img2) domain-containing protein [Sarocladium implicatum]|nr:mitochondrial large subunit ribosomal protein (Img2) domain-containing protein [Sarocladium implicatum]